MKVNLAIYLIVVGFGIGLVSVSLTAQPLPPVGDRIYELVPRAQERAMPPAKIVPDQVQKRRGKFMRDPELPPKARTLSEAPPPPKPKPQPAYQESKLNFPALAVSGRYTKPRVDFSERRLQVNPAEEALDFNFLDRLLESARRQEALLSTSAP